MSMSTALRQCISIFSKFCFYASIESIILYFLYEYFLKVHTEVHYDFAIIENGLIFFSHPNSFEFPFEKTSVFRNITL